MVKLQSSMHFYTNQPSVNAGFANSNNHSQRSVAITKRILDMSELLGYCATGVHPTMKIIMHSVFGICWCSSMVSTHTQNGFSACKQVNIRILEGTPVPEFWLQWNLNPICRLQMKLHMWSVYQVVEQIDFSVQIRMSCAIQESQT